MVDRSETLLAMLFQPQRSRTLRPVLLGLSFLIWLGTSACGFTGSLQKDFHQPAGVYGQKLPLKVSLIADPPIKTQQLRLLNGAANINVYPGLVNATVAELATIFDDVRIIDHPSQAKDDEILAVVRLAIQAVSADTISDHYIYACKVGILFRDQSGRSITLRENTQQFEYKNPVAAQVAAFMTGFTLFLGSPITVPVISYSTWSHARNLLEVAIVMRTTPLFTTGSHVARDSKSLGEKHRFVVWSEYPGVVSAITELLQKGGNVVVERSHMHEVIEEQRLRLTHTPDDEADILHVGKLIGADRVIFAEVTTRPEIINQPGLSGSLGFSHTVYYASVAVRSVSVESGEVRWSGTAQPRMPINNPDVALANLAQWARPMGHDEPN